jgi:serine/threonine-protein kinase RsbW
MISYKTNSIPLDKGSFEPHICPPTSRNGQALAKMIGTVISSDFGEVQRFLDQINGLLVARQYASRDLFAVRLALDEALTNAVKHGNQLNPDKKVLILYGVSDDWFEVTITDEGAGFNPEAVANPLASDNMERPCGRGLLLMRHYMSRVVFHPPGNKVTLTKLRNQPTRNARA